MTKRLAMIVAAIEMGLCYQPFAVHAAPHDTWGMWQGNAGHTGYLPDTLLMGRRQFAWSERISQSPISGLAVSNNTVYTVDSATYLPDGGLIAHLDSRSLADGLPLWNVSFDPGVTVSAPAYADGRIFVVENTYVDYMTSAKRFLSAFDAATGAPVFRVPLALPGATYDSPTVSASHVFYESRVQTGPFITNPSYSFGSIAESDGSPEWETMNTSGDGDMPAVSGGKLYGYTNELNVFDAATGAPDGNIVNPADPTDYSTGRSPVIANSIAYATQGGRIIAFDLLAQTIAWAKDVNAAGQIATDGISVFYLSAGALTLRDAATGNLQWGWEAPLGGLGSTQGYLTDNFIVTKSDVILTDGVSTYFINRMTHMPDAGYSVGGLIALAGDRLVVADPQGIVTVFVLPSDELFADLFE